MSPEPRVVSRWLVFFSCRTIVNGRVHVKIPGRVSLLCSSRGVVNDTASRKCSGHRAKRSRGDGGACQTKSGLERKIEQPGVSIKLSEVGKGPSHQIYYELMASGFPVGLKYIIVTWPANRLKPEAGMTGVTLDPSGLAICAGIPGTCKGDGPNSPIHLQFSPVKSEPIRLSLVSDDEKRLRAFTSLVPIPNRLTDRRCSLEEVMLAPLSSLVALQGSGYEPNAEIQFSSESEGEHHDGQLKPDSDGNLYFAMGLGVKGKENGVAKVNIVSHGCSLSLSIPWGRDSYQYE